VIDTEARRREEAALECYILSAKRLEGTVAGIQAGIERSCLVFVVLSIDTLAYIQSFVHPGHSPLYLQLAMKMLIRPSIAVFV
jgi:hypothetical protein